MYQFCFPLFYHRTYLIVFWKDISKIKHNFRVVHYNGSFGLCWCLIGVGKYFTERFRPIKGSDSPYGTVRKRKLLIVDFFGKNIIFKLTDHLKTFYFQNREEPAMYLKSFTHLKTSRIALQKLILTKEDVLRHHFIKDSQEF